MTFDHQHIWRTFLVITVQSKVVGVKLLKHAPAMGQVEAAPEQVETWIGKCFVLIQVKG